MTDHLDALFAAAAAERLALFERMALDYRNRGDNVSAQNLEAKADELRKALKPA